MSSNQIILFGAGGHAKSCIDVIEQQGRYEIAGLVGGAHEKLCKVLGYSVIATDEDLQLLAANYRCALVAVGQIRTPASRIRLFDLAHANGFTMPVVEAPTANISRHASVGAGTIVMPGAIINAGATIGKNCIVNSNALIEHDASVADHCHISTGAIINGGVSIGSGSFIGSGSVVKERVKIGERCFIGMGLAVRRNLRDLEQLLQDS
jgi:sugar O-acyltransferase (sialic acid O-acetyltransferase NeuD family)